MVMQARRPEIAVVFLSVLQEQVFDGLFRGCGDPESVELALPRELVVETVG